MSARVPGNALAIAALFTAALSAGCRSTPPPIEQYLLALPTFAPLMRDEPPMPVLRMLPLVARGFLDHAEIAWREGDVRAGAYRYRRFGELPAETATRALRDALRAIGGFEAVDGPDGRARGSFTLRGELLGLHEQCDEGGGHPTGVAEGELGLESAADDPTRPLRRTTLHARREVAASDESMEASVRAISAAYADVIGDLVAQVATAAHADCAAADAAAKPAGIPQS